MKIKHALFEEAGEAPAAGGAPAPETPSESAPASLTPATPDESPYAGLIGSDGKFADKWLDKLPDEFNPYRATLANYPTLPALAKALYDNKAAAREKAGLKIPGEDATPEAVAEFRKALGVPEKPEDYGIGERPADLPPNVEWNGELAKGFAEAAHKLGMPPAQAKGLMQWFNESQAAAAAAEEAEYNATRETHLAELKTAFGNKYDARMNDATRAAKSLGIDVENSPAFFDPKVVLAFAKIADTMKEDALVTGQSPHLLSPDQQGKDIQFNEQNPLHFRYRKNDPEIVALVNSLRAQG